MIPPVRNRTSVFRQSRDDVRRRKQRFQVKEIRLPKNEPLLSHTPSRSGKCEANAYLEFRFGVGSFVGGFRTAAAARATIGSHLVGNLYTTMQ